MSKIFDGEKKYLVADSKEVKSNVLQPYVLQHILTNYMLLIQPLRKSYRNIYLRVFICGKNTSWKHSCAAKVLHTLTPTDIRILIYCCGWFPLCFI